MDATHEPEEWRPVLGHEGAYEVSNQGRVRSLDRVLIFPSGHSRRAKGKILKPWRLKRVGHVCVTLQWRQKSLVHVLVLEAFVGPRPEGLVSCHNNGIPDDNRVENLRWDTYGENNKDLVRHGTHWQTRKTHCPRGHEFTTENTRNYLYQGTWRRYCRACGKINSRATKARMRAQRPADWRPQRSGPARGSHCARGHEFTPENTYTRPDGKGRQCRRCQTIRSEERSY